MSTILYSRRKKGHYDNWEKVFIRLINCDVEDGVFKQLFYFFRYDKIIFLDIDGLHLLFLPLIILRSIIRKKNFLFSNRTEILLGSGVRTFFQKQAFKLLKYLPKTKIISIHKDGNVNKLNKFVDNFIYDIQYWDLAYLNIKPKAVRDLFLSDNQNHQKKILVFGSLNSKRLRSEWLSYLSNNNPPFQIIFAGYSNFSANELRCLNNSYVIDRYLSDGEMIYLFNLADYIACYRSVKINYPSGIFGRAIQLRKRVIVKSGDYFSKYHNKYSGLIVIKNLIDLEKIKLKENNNILEPNYDDSKLLIRLIK